MTIYAKIEHEDFAALVQGKSVEIEGRYPQGTVTVKLILADIGFSKMLVTIGDAMVGRVRTREVKCPKSNCGSALNG